MAIAISANDEHQPAGALSPTDIKAQQVEGGRPSSVQMGQEKVIALLLQQQQEVLREIRDQMGLALSQENKQEIAGLVLSSLKEHRLHKQPATSGPPHHPSLRLYTGRKTRAVSKRTGKKRAIVRRRRQRSSRSSHDQDRATSHHATSTAPESGPYEYSSSSDQNSGSSPSAAVEPACFPLDSTAGTHEHRSGIPPSASASVTVIRQRVEKPTEQAEVSLDGLWLPSVSPSSGLVSPGTAAVGGRINSNDGGATATRGGSWANSSRQSMQPCASTLTTRMHVYGGSEKLPRRSKARPLTVGSHSSKRCVKSQRLSRQEGENVPAKGGLDIPLRFQNDTVEGSDPRRGDGVMVYDYDVHDGSGGGRGEGEERRGGGLTPVMMGRFAQRGAIDDSSSWRGESAVTTPDISRDTASMLQRSQALVARAKACCGQAARASTTNHGKREGNADLRLPSHGRTSVNSPPITNRHHRGNAETSSSGGDVDGGAGEAGGILFAPSPYPTGRASLSAPSPLGDVAEEEGECRVSPPALASAARSRTPVGNSGSAGGSSLEHVAHAEAETLKNGTAPAVRHPAVSGGAGDEREEDPEREQRHASDGGLPPHRAASDGTGALGDEATEAREDRRGSVGSTISSVSGVQGRRRRGSGSSGARKARKRQGEEPWRGNGGADNESAAKIDTEWENEIAKNILSLYQTKLKADLDVKKTAKDNELMRKQRGYLTIEEEEAKQEQQQQQQQEQLVRFSRAATAAPGRVRVPSKRDARDGVDPSSVTATNGLDLHTTREATTPSRARVERGIVATPSPSSRRPVTVASKPREVVIGRDLSLGRAPPSPPRTAAGATSDSADKASGDRAAAAAGSKGRGGFRGSKVITVPTRGGGEAVVVVPKRPRPIWFAGSGAIQAEWSALPGGARVVRDLEGLEEQGRYTRYVAVVEGLLTSYLRADDQQGPGELVKRLWRQLVATCIAFGVRSTENRRFERALELLKRAGTLLSRQVLDKRASQELRAFVHDAYGLYFLRRGKSSAALDYVQKAMKTHARMRDWGHVTKCHLHSSVVLSKLNRHDEALRCLGQVLSMVDEGNLDVGGNSPQKLCLVAICYHNMAVEQLILRHAGEACMSSQNARRLARLCLSYSNRWLHSFEGTHKLALAELARSLPSAGGSAVGGRGGDEESKEEQRDILKRLTEELFS